MNLLNMIKNLRFLLILLLAVGCSTQSKSQWFYMWENSTDRLEAAPGNEKVPVLINGKTYRIIKIENFQGNTVRNITVSSAPALKVEVEYLPVISNFKNQQIVDLVMPIQKNAPLYNAGSRDKYFLVSFSGVRNGENTVKIDIESNRKKYSFSTAAMVAAERYTQQAALNVFAYFDYNFILKDMKQQVITDLAAHQNNVLVIPPMGMPDILNPNPDFSVMSQYLKGATGKFEYYILYHNLTSRNINFNDATVQRSVKNWYQKANAFFKSAGISSDRVLIFPFDEAKGKDINKILNAKKVFRSLGIDNPFYASVDNVQAGQQLLSKVEYLQLLPEVLAKLNTSGTTSKLWTYQLTYGSRDRKPEEYRQMGLTAFRNGATGIGVWSYSDVSVAADNSNISDFKRGKGTWEMKYKAPSAEYSLIYRLENNIYPTLRWKALSYSLEEYYWLNLYRQKMGTAKSRTLLNRVSAMPASEWEQLKLSLIK